MVETVPEKKEKVKILWGGKCWSPRRGKPDLEGEDKLDQTYAYKGIVGKTRALN